MKKEWKDVPVTKNDEIELLIEALSSEGNGIARYQGMTVFVPYTAVGDRVQARIIKVQKNYAIGKLLEVLDASSDRIIPDCPVYGRCGGCVYRHISYEAECRAKTQKVSDALTRIASLSLIPEPLLAAQATDQYRNKAQIPVGGNKDHFSIGFYAPHSHRIVDCRHCLLQPEAFAAATQAFAQWMEENRVEPYCEETHKGLVRHLYLRRAPSTGEMMVCVVVNASRLPQERKLVEQLRCAAPEIVSVCLNENRRDTNVILGENYRLLYGKDTITDWLCGVQFQLSAASFYQVNSAQAQRLYEIVQCFAEPGPEDILLDLYCGTGTIGLTMASKAKELIGVEVVPSAVEDARRNARINGITNARFICGDAAQAADWLTAEGIRPSVILLDPPRKGCEQQLLDLIAHRMRPGRLVYVSCDPATLARDLARLQPLGYEVKRVIPVDLFPRTAHVETVCLLTRES